MAWQNMMNRDPAWDALRDIQADYGRGQPVGTRAGFGTGFMGGPPQQAQQAMPMQRASMGPGGMQQQVPPQAMAQNVRGAISQGRGNGWGRITPADENTQRQAMQRRG